ncbi:MAG: putative toxin-antitoxin system toxin component, PIN family [Chloroflexi bacterium]|nr:putative toxin-antitoxin system toxin component, PIN family [Chloroflexota bacterium]
MSSNSKPRVFTDSNVIVSGLFLAEGAPAAIIDHFLSGKLTLVLSQQVLDEVVRTVKEKLPDMLPSLMKLLTTVPPEIREDPTPFELSRWDETIDVEAAPILAAAAAARPDFLVTADKHFFENPDIPERSGLCILTPEQLLERLGEATGNEAVSLPLF